MKRLPAKIINDRPNLTSYAQAPRCASHRPRHGELAVHTVGVVISEAEPIMLVVPEDDNLVIEAKVAPQDIDHMQAGQSAFVRFTAVNQ